MSTIRPLLNLPEERNARFAIFLSGGGSNAEQVLRHLANLENAPPVEAVALVTDAPETSRANEIGAEFNLPVVACDIRAFYAERGETRVSIATERGREIRAEWTDALRQKLLPLEIDFAVFAGFVPLTNLTGDFPCLNVHPGDLTYLKDNARHLVGLHTIPIERAILEGLDELRTSVIQALPYTGGGDDMDNGPILGLSPAVQIDLGGAEIRQLQAEYDRRPERRPKGGFNDHLENLAKAHQERLKEGGDWVVLPRVVVDFGRGLFAVDDDSGLYYKIGKKWHPIETVIYEGKTKEVVFLS